MPKFEFTPHPTDDLALLDQVAVLISGVAQTGAYDHYAVVRIQNWFDQKWVGFTGVFRNYHEDFGPNTYDVHRLNKALPPFSRSRIESLAMVGESRGNLPAIFYFSTNNNINRRASLLTSVPIQDGSNSWEWYVGYKQTDHWKAIRYWNINSGEVAQYAKAGT